MCLISGFGHRILVALPSPSHILGLKRYDTEVRGEIGRGAGLNPLDMPNASQLLARCELIGSEILAKSELMRAIIRANCERESNS